MYIVQIAVVSSTWGDETERCSSSDLTLNDGTWSTGGNDDSDSEVAAYDGFSSCAGFGSVIVTLVLVDGRADWELPLLLLILSSCSFSSAIVKGSTDPCCRWTLKRCCKGCSVPILFTRHSNLVRLLPASRLCWKWYGWWCWRQWGRRVICGKWKLPMQRQMRMLLMMIRELRIWILFG